MLSEISNLIVTICILLVILTAVFFLIKLILLNYKFEKSRYREVSGNSFFNTIRDKGNYGEYLTFVFLEKLKGGSKLLANLYIPKEDGTTTEVDLLMIDKTGIYVFESKNYSGWIFGKENYYQWTQTLKGGVKTKFSNPIIQNIGHIKALGNLLKVIDVKCFYSYIIFSQRCELKDVPPDIENRRVLKRNRLLSKLKRDIARRPECLSTEQIDEIYSLLKEHTLADDTIKQKHIEDIEIKFKKSKSKKM